MKSSLAQFLRQRASIVIVSMGVMTGVAFAQSRPQASFKTQLWAPDQAVCILVHNPRNEPLQLPPPYTPPAVGDIYGPGVTEQDLAAMKNLPEYRQAKILSLANVGFTVVYSDSANEGFNDPTLGAARRRAFEYALGIWAANLEGPADISVNATMTARGGTATNAVLASAAPSQFWQGFRNAPMANTFYAECLAEIISGSDPDASTLDIGVDFNSSVDNSVVLGNSNWYYGTDAQPGIHFDFVTVTLHEICHGLGFIDSFAGNGSFGLNPSGNPTIFDRFLVNGTGAQLIALPVSPNNVTGNNVFWNGLKGQFTYNNDFGNPGTVPMFAPTPYQPASSIGHLNEATFTGAWDLETPFFSNAVHNPDPIVMGILQDIGYSLPNSRYVDINASGFEDGSSANPFNTVVEGVNAVPATGFVRILPGAYFETLTISRAMQLRSCGGIAVIGR